VPSQTSHDQPLPKRFTPPSIIASFSCENESNASSTADRSAPPGSPPPSGLMICQNREWFACPPTLLRTAVCLSSGSASRFVRMLSTEAFAHSVPSSAAFAFVTYAPWCRSWWIRIVSASICGSSAS
jgi:hypothetical protein